VPLCIRDRGLRAACARPVGDPAFAFVCSAWRRWVVARGCTKYSRALNPISPRGIFRLRKALAASEMLRSRILSRGAVRVVSVRLDFTRWRRTVRRQGDCRQRAWRCASVRSRPTTTGSEERGAAATWSERRNRSGHNCPCLKKCGLAPIDSQGVTRWTSLEHWVANVCTGFRRVDVRRIWHA
jgi:hypothetical protein